jgi:hypothetical protein
MLLRTFQIARRAKMQELEICDRDLIIAGFLGFCTDIVYFAGFCYGLIYALIGRKLQH